MLIVLTTIKRKKKKKLLDHYHLASNRETNNKKSDGVRPLHHMASSHKAKQITMLFEAYFLINTVQNIWTWEK